MDRVTRTGGRQLVIADDDINVVSLPLWTELLRRKLSLQLLVLLLSLLSDKVRDDTDSAVNVDDSIRAKVLSCVILLPVILFPPTGLILLLLQLLLVATWCRYNELVFWAVVIIVMISLLSRSFFLDDRNINRTMMCLDIRILRQLQRCKWNADAWVGWNGRK